MRTERVELDSDGVALRGLLRLPDAARSPYPFIVQGPGWLGLADANLYVPYHEALAAAGFALLIFDYRGFGASDGERGSLSVDAQIRDWRAAITHLRARADMDSRRYGVFGSGGTGGGNAIVVASLDPGVRACVAQVPVADGRDWLHRMRREHEWVSYLARLQADRRARAAGRAGETVDPKLDIMVETPERLSTTVKADVKGRVPEQVPLASALEILEYRPIDAAARISGLMVVAVADDAVTPTDHATRLYDAARSPKRLVLQRETTHYAAYKQYGERVTPLIVEWFARLVRDAAPA